MTNHGDYADPGPTREEIDATPGPLVLEFGANECGYCRAARPVVEAAFATMPPVPHVKVADGPGRPLGRSFKVKLWPTLVFLFDGVEVGRVVRPESEAAVRTGLQPLVAGEGGDRSGD